MEKMHNWPEGTLLICHGDTDNQQAVVGFYAYTEITTPFNRHWLTSGTYWQHAKPLEGMDQSAVSEHVANVKFSLPGRRTIG